jgi:hypothetical protein
MEWEPLLILGVMCWYVGVKTRVNSQKVVFEKMFFSPNGVLHLKGSRLHALVLNMGGTPQNTYYYLAISSAV